jgi:hypothetical protein
MVCSSAARELPTTKETKMSDLPNFPAWSNENLAQFATEAYRKMQQQQETIEQLQGDFKDAMCELRKFMEQKK